MDDTNTLMDKPFSKGDKVLAAGEYVCVPCGYKKQYQPGEVFGECMSCLSGTPSGQHEEFLAGEEMWEKAMPAPDEK